MISRGGGSAGQIAENLTDPIAVPKGLGLRMKGSLTALDRLARVESNYRESSEIFQDSSSEWRKLGR